MKERVTALRRLGGFLGSSTGFWTIVVLFVLQALWIALSNRYPMAFDEDYHLGIIRLYAHHLSPFWHAQPAHANTYGAVYRDPSYLYHYLFSFPYRLINTLTHDQTIQVLYLRVLNIGLFTSSLVVFRRLLRSLGLSSVATNFCLLLFIFIPAASLLAAQINYDNLFIPLVALSLLWTVEFGREVLTYKRINSYHLLRLLILCLVASLVKYAFLPFFAAIGVFLTIIFAITFRRFKKFGLSLAFGFTFMTRLKRWVVAVCLVAAVGLFVQRYGVNIAYYHTPLPDCSQVLSVEECSDYGPWDRDYVLASQKTPGKYTPIRYVGAWFYGMWLRLFFTVDGPDTLYQTRSPLLFPGLGAIIFGVASIALVVRYGKRLWHDYSQLFGAPLLMTLFYITSLWFDGYQAYVHTGQPVAINGRYLLPVLPVLFALAVLAWRHALGKRPRLRTAFAAVALISMVWGGGALTFILRSNDSWYWPNAAVRHVNFDVRQTVGPAVPGYSNPVQFL